MTTATERFEIGKTYCVGSRCDRVYFKVVARTARTATFELIGKQLDASRFDKPSIDIAGNGETQKVSLRVDDGAEYGTVKVEAKNAWGDHFTDRIYIEATKKFQVKLKKTATVEVDEYAVSTEAQDVAPKAEIEQAQAQTTPTIEYNEPLFDPFKFEAGRTYFRLNADGTPFTLKVEARTAHMLTGTTTEGTRKYKIGLNALGEYVQTGKDEDGYEQFIRARCEFIPAIVEIVKVTLEAFNEWAGKTPNNDPEPEHTNNQPIAELPKGTIEVANAEYAFKLIAPYFPKGLTFHKAANFLNGEDEFTFANSFNSLFLTATCDKGNRRVEMLEVIDTFASDSERKPLTVYIKPTAELDDVAAADREVEVLDELERLEDELFDARAKKSTARIDGDLEESKRWEKKITEIQKRIDKLTDEWVGLTERYVKDDTSDESETPPIVSQEFIRLLFNFDEALNAKKILKPLANKACVEFGDLTIDDFDNTRKTCEVLTQVFGSTTAIDKFKTLLADRIIIYKMTLLMPTDNKTQSRADRTNRLNNILKFPCGDFNPVKPDKREATLQAKKLSA